MPKLYVAISCAVLLVILGQKVSGQEGNFGVTMADGEVMLVHSKDSSALDSAWGEMPGAGIQIMCEQAKLESTSPENVVIMCVNATFATKSGLNGRAQRVVCLVKENRVLFQNDGQNPVEIRLNQDEQKADLVVVGNVLSLDLATNLLRALDAQTADHQLRSVVPILSNTTPAVTPTVHVPDASLTPLLAPQQNFRPASPIPNGSTNASPFSPNGK